MNDELKISIIIPCFNHGKYVLEAIESVEQYSDKSIYEIIIINDGSTDKYTNEVLLKLKERGYNVVFQENQGLGRTRNNGIKIAQGKYILPLDADNRIYPAYISESINILDNNYDIAVVYGDAKIFGDQNSIRKTGAFNKEKILKGNYIDACAVFRKTAWEKCGGYKEDMPFQGWEDWELWINMVENGFNFHYINEVLFDYRVAESSMISSINDAPMKQRKLLTYVYYNHIELYKELPDPFSAQILYKDRTQKLEEEYLEQIKKVRNSNSYKLGNFILKPFSFIKNLFS